jgi:hypothetical protein
MRTKEYLKKDGTTSTYKYPSTNKSRVGCEETREYNLSVRRAKGILTRAATAEINYIKRHGEDMQGVVATPFEYLCTYYG